MLLGPDRLKKPEGLVFLPPIGIILKRNKQKLWLTNAKKSRVQIGNMQISNAIKKSLHYHTVINNQSDDLTRLNGCLYFNSYHMKTFKLLICLLLVVQLAFALPSLVLDEPHKLGNTSCTQDCCKSLPAR